MILFTLGWVWFRGGLVWGGLVQGVPAPGGYLAETPHPTATAAGGTHPTGMHSCFFFVF